MFGFALACYFVHETGILRKKGTKLKIVFRKKVFPDVDKKTKNEEETGGHKTQCSFGCRESEVDQ